MPSDRLEPRTTTMDLTRMDSPLPASRDSSSAIRIASYVLAAAMLLLVLGLHMLPALLAGLLVYELVQAMTPLLGQRISGDRARVLVVPQYSTLPWRIRLSMLITTSSTGVSWSGRWQKNRSRYSTRSLRRAC